MADVVLIKEDVFNGARVSASQESTQTDSSSPHPQRAVRRPMDGIGIKRDKYAVLRVYTSSGTQSTDIINSSAPTLKVGYTTNLLIQSVQETRHEKSQIVQTFGEDFVYFFGEQPTQIQISAQLLDTLNFQWHQEWWVNYNESLRGTRLVDKEARVYLEIDDVMFEGYILNSATTRIADDQHRATLSFGMLVTNKIYLTEIRNKYLPPERLTSDQIRAIAGGSYSDASAYKLGQAEELETAVTAVIEQASRGPSVLTSSSAVTIQNAGASSPDSTIDSVVKYLNSIYQRMVEYSEKPYYETRSANEYPNGASRNIKEGTESDRSSISARKSDQQQKSALKQIITPLAIEQANQSTPVHKGKGSEIEELRGQGLIPSRDSFIKGLLTPRGALPYNVVYPPRIPFSAPTSISTSTSVSSLGETSSTQGSTSMAEGVPITDITSGTLLDQILSQGIEDIVQEATIEIPLASELPSTPSGGMSGYDPTYNPTPLSSATSETGITSGRLVLRGVAPSLYSGEESRRVRYPQVIT